MPKIDFVSHIDTVLKATDAAFERAAESIGQRMETHAKLYVTAGVYESPEGKYIRTGNLRNSITHDSVSDDHSVTIVVGSPVDYAPYVELGTGVYASDGKGRKTPWRYQDNKGNWHTTNGMPPRPFLRPAVENHIKEYREVLQQELSNP